MHSRISVNICLPLLWLYILGTVAACAQQGAEKPASYSNNIGSEVSHLRNQAAQGGAMANYQLGHLYMTGTGVSLNYTEAAKFLHAAAEQGLPEAELLLGHLYEHGEGVPRDYRKAFDHYSGRQRRET